MKAPQIIMIVLFTIGLWNSLIKHGNRKEGYENFWISLLSVAIQVLILKWGGFF